MLSDLFELTRSDGLEAGGFLFGPASWSWDKEIRVLHATATADAIRTSGTLRLDAREWLEAERSFERQGLDDVLLGIWHSHPRTFSRDGTPSSADLRAFLAARDWPEEQGRSNAFGVSLLFSASEFWGDSWAAPGAHAFVTRRDRFGRGVTEPAEVSWR
jgi:hypothetical protein